MKSCKSFLRAMRGFCFICVFFLLADVLLSLSLSLSLMLTRYTLERIDISRLYQGESNSSFLFSFLSTYINDEFRLRCGLERGV